MELKDIHDLNLDEIEEILSIVVAGIPMSAIGEQMQFLSQGLEARAIGFLLLDFDTPALFRNLQRSAQRAAVLSSQEPRRGLDRRNLSGAQPNRRAVRLYCGRRLVAGERHSGLVAFVVDAGRRV